MAKRIVFEEEARKSLLRGIDAVADAPADDYEFDFGLSDGALRAVCTAFPMDYL